MDPSKYPGVVQGRGGFVGRSAQMALVDRVTTEGARLVTLLGPPGIGKSRLLREVVVHGVRIPRVVELSGATSEEELRALVEPKLLEPGDAGPARVVGLDDVDHVARAVASLVREWLSEHPSLVLVVSSRQLLRVSLETPVEVPPLVLPSPEARTLEQLREGEAGGLLLQRAGGARLRDEDAHHLAEIVRLLDGIPLAIELAARRLRVMTPEQLATRLERSVDVLGRGARDHRHASLRAAIQTSVESLEPKERDALAQCSVFRRGFSLEAAEAVIDLRRHDGADLLEVLQELADRSLVFTERDAGPDIRFGVYESVRAVAGGELDPVEREDLVLRHARHYAERGLVLAKEASPEGFVPRLDVDLDNLVGAVESVVEEATLTAEHLELIRTGAMRLIDALKGRAKLGAFSLVHDNFSQVTSTSPEDAASDEGQSATLKARVWCFLATALAARGRPARARRMFARALESAQRSPAAHLVARVHLSLGALHACEGSDGAAQQALAEALRSLPAEREPESSRLEVLVRAFVGNVHLLAGRASEAHVAFEEAQSAARDHGFEDLETLLEGNLATAARDRRAWDAARAHLETMSQRIAKRDEPILAATVQAGLAAIAHECGDWEVADRGYRESSIRLGAGAAMRAEAVVSGWRTILLASRDELAAAREAFAHAQRSARAVGDAGTLRSIRLARAALELCEARSADRSGRVESVERHRSRAERLLVGAELEAGEGGAETYSTADQADDHRLERRLVERDLRRDAIVLSRDGTSFTLPGAEGPVTVTQPRLSRLLSILIAQHETDSGAGLDAATLIERMWPGERMDFQSGQNRLQVSLSSLRGLGLRELIARREGSYALDPNALIVVSD